MRKHPESILQRSCITWFDHQYPQMQKLLFAIPNGGKRSRIEAAIMQGEGVRAGTPDLFLAVPSKSFHGLFIEMKSGRGVLTEHQLQSMLKLEKQGYMVIVCRSLDAFIDIIIKYLQR